MSNTSNKRVIAMPSLAEDKGIRAAATGDEDAQPLKDVQLKAMVPLKSLRGRPPSAEKKQLVSVRYSQEVLEYFRGTGAGWQARMDGALLEYVAKQSKRRTKNAT
jgi:uncharacterized protein (DUF4415 family)